MRRATLILVSIFFLAAVIGLYLYIATPLGGSIITHSHTNPDTAVQYVNTQYGFSLDLPHAWRGFIVLHQTWAGSAPGTATTSVSGPLIALRHPAWTEAQPRQDIPIMVFTQRQWQQLNADQFHIGAAAVPPTILGENDRFVFALPARYNYAFPTGFEEVDTILRGNPLHTYLLGGPTFTP